MKITQEKIKQARQADLKAYLEKKGHTFKREGLNFRSRINSSLVVRGNMYVYNAGSDQGNSLDYAIRQLGLDFKTALTELTNPDLSCVVEAAHEMSSVEKTNDSDFKKIYAYLIKKRGISKSVVSTFFNRHLIKPLKINGITNAAFCVEDGGFEIEGTTDIKFKGLTSDIEYGKAFVFKNGNPDCLYFFESAIDLMSYFDLKKGSMEPGWLISMAGVKKHVVEAYKRRFPHAQIIILCDNDAAGKKFLKSLDFEFKNISPKTKDWNEDLTSGQEKK